MQNKNDFTDLTLTPKNAKVKGYKYVDDVLYDDKVTLTYTDGLLELIKRHNCKLGTPTMNTDKDHFFGLYAPIDEIETKPSTKENNEKIS